MEPPEKRQKTDDTSLSLVNLPTEILSIIFTLATWEYDYIQEILALRTTCHTISLIIQQHVLPLHIVPIGVKSIHYTAQMQSHFPAMKFALVGSDELLQLEDLHSFHQIIFVYLKQTPDWSKLCNIPHLSFLRCDSLTDLSELQGVPHLDLTYCRNITHIPKDVTTLHTCCVFFHERLYKCGSCKTPPSTSFRSGIGFIKDFIDGKLCPCTFNRWSAVSPTLSFCYTPNFRGRICQKRNLCEAELLRYKTQ